MKISRKIWFLTITIILIISVALLIQINVSLTKQNKIEIAAIKENEYKKAKNTLKNYVELAEHIIEQKVSDSTDLDYLKKKYGKELQNIIDSGESIIESKLEQYKKGKLTLSQAKSLAIEDIKKIRYDNGTGYIWINDITQPFPKMVMHPTVPALNNTILNDPKYNCALGKNENLFVAAVDIGLKEGSGYVDYLWPKPTKNGLTEDRPKLSYVRYIPELDWIIGTGIYIDDAVEDAKNESLQVISTMRYDNNVGYFWINDTTKPVPKMILHPISPELNGTILYNTKYNKVKGTNNNLFTEFVNVTEKDGTGFVEYSWPKPTPDGTSTEEQPKLSYGERIKEWNWILASGFYIDDINTQIELKTKELKKQLITMNIFIFSIAAILGLIIVIITSILIKRIIAPLNKTTVMLQNISTGEADLTLRLKNESRDEIGELSTHYNNFIIKLLNIVNKIKTSNIDNKKIESLLSQSTNLTENEVVAINNQILSIEEKVKDLNSSILDSNSNLDVVLNHIDKLDANIDDESSAIEESSAAINQMVASINSVSSITRNKNNLIDSLIDKTSNGGKLIDKSTSLINSVNTQLEEIKNIATIISKISARTNLLAMNAAIEAAHAGDAGRGFSVVADEIRKLANTTSDSVKDITEVIKKVSINIEDSSNSSISAKDAFNLVENDVHEFADGLKEITLATQELSTGGNEILEALSLLGKVSLEVQESSSDMNEKTNIMKDNMLKAEKASKEVTTSINEIVNSSANISEVIKTMLGYNKELTAITKNLDSEISKFKTE